MDNSKIIQAIRSQREILKILIDHHTTINFNPYENERLRKLLIDLDEQLESIE